MGRIPWLDADARFPPIHEAMDEPNGLLAAGDDLSVNRLLDAYRHGIFPWFSDGEPVLWWSPDPRMVLFVDEFKVSRSLAKAVRQRVYEVRVDTAFRAVMIGCSSARAGQPGTWISAPIIEAYCRLYEHGFAHSFESWYEGELVGGLYGVAIGRMFFGESMFARMTDASKVALYYLVQQLRARGFTMIDCQQETSHLASLGARPVSRAVFAKRLAGLVNSLKPALPWTSGAIALPDPT